MKQLSLEEIHQLELNMMDWLYDKCKKAGIEICLSGGTLLGAVRHKGFIPWDDDIDLMLPREEYKKIERLAQEIHDERYQILSYGNRTFDYTFMKVVDTYTQLNVSEKISNVENMLWIDIFPVDGLPDSPAEVAAHYKKIRFLQHWLGVATSKAFRAHNLVNSIIKPFISVPAKLMGKNFWLSKMDELAQKYPFSTSKNVGVTCWGYGVKECLPKSAWESCVDVEFEGRTCKAPVGWKQYLRNLYDNYMELPPVEKRMTHDLKVYLIDGKEME